METLVQMVLLAAEAALADEPRLADESRQERLEELFEQGVRVADCVYQHEIARGGETGRAAADGAQAFADGFQQGIHDLQQVPNGTQWTTRVKHPVKKNLSD